jgi:hypothetical protein
MKHSSLVAAVLLLVTLSERSAIGDEHDARLVDHINTLDQQSTCHLMVKKIFEGDTDRGMEATLYNCPNGVQRIEIIFGLSRKDLILRYLLVNGSAAKADVLDRKYRSTADGDVDFDHPLPSSSRGVLYFDGVRLVSISSDRSLDITEKNRSAKALAVINLANAVRAALLSKEPHPDFESISFLTGIFGEG